MLVPGTMVLAGIPVSALKATTELSVGGSEELKGVLTVDAGKVEAHLAGKVRAAVEEVLNNLLDAEADERCGAKRYVHSLDRQDTRAGHYRRKLETQAGTVDLKVPKLRKLPLESAIIDRYRRKETSVEEALVEMYLAGVWCAVWRTSPRRCEFVDGERIESAHLWQNRGMAYRQS